MTDALLGCLLADSAAIGCLAAQPHRFTAQRGTLSVCSKSYLRATQPSRMRRSGGIRAPAATPSSFAPLAHATYSRGPVATMPGAAANVSITAYG